MDVEIRRTEHRLLGSRGDLNAAASLILANRRLGKGGDVEIARTLLMVIPEIRREVLGACDVEASRQTSLLFLGAMKEHYQTALKLHDDYGWLKTDEAEMRPTEAGTTKALFADLQANPAHMEAIRNMKDPLLQLEPIFKPGEEGAGFLGIVNAMNSHLVPGQAATVIWESLRTRWNIPDEVAYGQGQVMGWNIVVTEGQKNLPRESNPWEGQQLSRQLEQWEERDGANGLHLPNKVRYTLSQMSELQRHGSSGIDTEGWALLEDPNRTRGSLVVSAYWFAGAGVGFAEDRPGVQAVVLHLRSSVVVRYVP